MVHVPNEFTRRLTPPGFEDFKELEQISEGAITPKCAHPPRANIRVASPKGQSSSLDRKAGCSQPSRPAVIPSRPVALAMGLWWAYCIHYMRMYLSLVFCLLQHTARQQHRDDEGPE